jgi:phosphoribosyl-ATP pyrophosphohydrolase/phosphoribosyl-AMP cyclohydrolase
MVIASIDLKSGKAVQLRQGKEKVLEHDDPLSLARTFDLYGEIAVIDLDAAQGTGINTGLIQQIISLGVCRVGGGIRTIERAQALIEMGARRVIIGSQVFLEDRINESFIIDLKKRIGKDRIIVAIDAIHGEIVTRAWTHRTGLQVLDVAPRLQEYCGEFLFTCVEREGMLQGGDIALVQQLTDRTTNRITLAGGIHTLEEITECASLGVDVQLGMALYTGTIDLGEAFSASLNWKTELIPTITQDTSGQVLMLAYSNQVSLRRTFQTKTMWYFSRSRQALWNKGMTSGNIQHLVRVRADCDQDAILATVRQKGVACHTGQYSCFGDKTKGRGDRRTDNEV